MISYDFCGLHAYKITNGDKINSVIINFFHLASSFCESFAKNIISYNDAIANHLQKEGLNYVILLYIFL